MSRSTPKITCVETLVPDIFVPFSGPWTTPPGISWAYGEICVLLTHLFCFGKLVARVITHKKFPDVVCDPDVDFDNQTDFVLFVTIDFTHYSNVLYKSLRLKQKTNITPLNILPRDQLQPPARLHSRLLL